MRYINKKGEENIRRTCQCPLSIHASQFLFKGRQSDDNIISSRLSTTKKLQLSSYYIPKFKYKREIFLEENFARIFRLNLYMKNKLFSLIFYASTMMKNIESIYIIVIHFSIRLICSDTIFIV